MSKIKKILLPVDFPNTSLRVLHQAAMVAQHFQSEIVILHVVQPQKDGRGARESDTGFAGGDMLAEITREAERNLDQSLGEELQGLVIRQVIVRGDPAQAIVQTAQAESADLIMMPSHGSTFNQFLLGSVTAKVLHGTECPVWTGGHTEESPGQKFAIKNVLCVIELGPRSGKALSWAATMAAKFSARLTLAHVTASVDLWGPGGTYIDQKWKTQLVSDASRRIASLQRNLGIKAEVLIGSGDVPKVVHAMVKQTNADLLVSECYPYGGNLRIHGYSIICAVPIPVLSV